MHPFQMSLSSLWEISAPLRQRYHLWPYWRPILPICFSSRIGPSQALDLLKLVVPSDMRSQLLLLLEMYSLFTLGWLLSLAMETTEALWISRELMSLPILGYLSSGRNRLRTFQLKGKNTMCEVSC
jgi:hypothetical protein